MRCIKLGFLASTVTVLTLGCGPSLRGPEDAQTDIIYSAKAIGAALVAERALTAGEKVIVQKLGCFNREQQAEAIWLDGLVTGLVGAGVWPIQDADTQPGSGGCGASGGGAAGAGGAGALLGMLPGASPPAAAPPPPAAPPVSASAPADPPSALERGVEAHRNAFLRNRKAAQELGVSKLVLVRWILNGGGRMPPAQTVSGKEGSFPDDMAAFRNRVMVRVVDVGSGAVVWADYFETMQDMADKTGARVTWKRGVPVPIPRK
ncbi:MAG: hypothetical protein FJZ01_25375 [Candidatus Sericytochromatia bacterium]|nr:hypothetical protein [Candidatus Tanganyikabacteria bacterium]